MTFKQDLLRTIEAFVMWWPFPRTMLAKRSKLASDYWLQDLFHNYIEEHKLATGFVDGLCFNPLMHMLDYSPCISCFYSNTVRQYALTLDSHKHINYIINNEPVKVQEKEDLCYLYPDSVMFARALGKLPYFLKLYSDDIDKVLHGWKQNPWVN